MSQPVRVTVLTENTVHHRNLLGEHGLAFWVDAGAKRVIFDTGQGLALGHNARSMDMSLAAADAVVLSHGHDDHTGGLDLVLTEDSRARVYGHPDVLRRKYKRYDNGTIREIGMAESGKSGTHRTGGLIPTNRPTEICEGLFVTGEIPRATDFEDTGGAFFLDEQCHQPDPLLDDQAMFFEATGGTVVLLGCAHAGVINTLAYIRELTDNRPVHAVIGGMHLSNASPERIGHTVEALRQFDIARIIPAHCTGAAAAAEMRRAFLHHCETCAVGATTEFSRP